MQSILFSNETDVEKSDKQKHNDKYPPQMRFECMTRCYSISYHEIQFGREI